MDILGTILAFGILFIIGILLVSILITALAYFITGKILGSINDEFTSALKLIGFGFLIFLVYAILSALNVAFVEGGVAFVISIVLAIAQIVVFIKAIDYVYDLGIGKSIGFFFLSLLVNAALLALPLILLFVLSPKSDTSDIPTRSDTVMEEAQEESQDMEVIDDSDIEDSSSLPKLPGLPQVPTGEETAETEEIQEESSLTKCFSSGQCNDNEFCYFDECRTLQDLASSFPTGNCRSLECEGCEGEHPFSNEMVLQDDSSIEFCAECDETGFFSCKEGYECNKGKCDKV